MEGEPRSAAKGLHGLRWAWLPITVLVVALGVWVTGGLITNDEAIAKGLTAAWFALAGAVAAITVYRRRALAVPVLAGYVVATVGIGGFLLYTSTVDRSVDEAVVTADPSSTPSSTQPGKADDDEDANGENPAADANVLVARGDFVSGEHPTEGVASAVRTSDGVFITLTKFMTDPGPDLRVYVVPQGVDVTAGEDIGALKGNQGDQQYLVPGSLADSQLPGSRVVIWCRAFSVAFGSAALRS